MVLVSTFLINLLCAMFPCEPLKGTPVIGQEDSNVTKSRDVSSSSLVVNTTNGLVEGYRMQAMSGRHVLAFEGIPFAQAPLGNLRFRDPIPKENWSGVFLAKSPGPDCLQMNLAQNLRILGREDCLYLNIYSPEVESNMRKATPNFPVIIFIHGGNFIFGSGREYGPSYLLQKDVILVTVNYRLGPLGFLSTGDSASPGNYGLKDQALAITWISENIQNFGGDPNTVTLGGQSAGGASVHFHMLSNRLNDKIQRAYSMSGSALNHWALQSHEKAIRLTNKLSRSLGCPGVVGSNVTDNQRILSCLRRKDANFLVAKQYNLFEMFVFPIILFGPVIENANGTSNSKSENATSSDPYVTMSPEDAYAKGQVANIPWLCTNTKDEAEYMIMALQNYLLLPSYLNHWRKTFPTLLDLKDAVPGKSELDVLVEDVKEHYLGAGDPYVANPKTLAEVGTDRYFTLATRRALHLHSQVAPTYSYLFGFKSHVGIAQHWNEDYRNWGSSHGEDLSILFNSSSYFKPIRRQHPTFHFSNLLINLLYNFALHGQPLYTNENGTKVRIWNPISPANDPTFLRIDYGDIKMIDDPFKSRIQLWEKFNVV